MPAAAGSRIETDIAELVEPNTTPVLPGQPTDTAEPPEPLENGTPRRWAEFCFSATGAIYVGLMMVPWELKKGQAWYTAAQSLVLVSAVLSVACLFWGNTHIKMIRFLSGKKIFVQVVILTLIDWLPKMIMPGVGWEVTDRIAATTGSLVFRLGFICFDSLKGMSRWFRLFSAFFFMLGNFWSVFEAYFLKTAATLYTISATNTTITTSAVQASIGTTIVTLTASMLVTIWQDQDFQYSALFRSYLPKLAVETAGVEPGSAEMQQILEQRTVSAAAWKGWPRKAAVVVLLSAVVFCASIVLSTTSLALDGAKESSMLITFRAAAVVLGGAGSCGFFHNNVSWPRLKYTFSSTQGILWMFYTLIYALAGLALPDPDTPISSVLATIYGTVSFLLWLSLESVCRISRVMHTSVTIFVALTMILTIYFSAYVWQNDPVLADLNGVGVPGTLTRYAAMRTCLINLSLLMAGSLVTVVKKNLSDNSYFIFISGNVLRREILEVESLSVNPDGHHDLVGHNSLVQRLSCHHQLSDNHCLETSENGDGGVEMQLNSISQGSGVHTGG